ncbi:nitroreductase [Chloroflexota bacterium]
MDILEGIETRRSIRAFTSTPIPQNILERILITASKSPSYRNTQPWEVAIITGEKKEQLSHILGEMVKANVTPNPDLPTPETWPPELDKRAAEHGARRFEDMGVDRDDTKQRLEMRLDNFKFYGAPCVLFLFIDSTLTPWSIFDTGLFSQSILLAAHSFGIGGCLQAVVTSYPDAIREFLNIAKTKKLIIGISLGYPDFESKANSHPSTRVTIDSFVQRYA